MISPLSQQMYGSLSTNAPYNGENQLSYRGSYQGSTSCHNSSCCPLEQALYQIANDVVTGIQGFLQRTLDGLLEKLGLNSQGDEQASFPMLNDNSLPTIGKEPSMFNGLLQGVTNGISNIFSGGVGNIFDSGVKLVSSFF